jgi:hypothetical protein
MLLRPRRAWAAIAEEPTSGADLIGRYVAPLAGFHAFCSLVGVLVFGYSIAGVGLQASPLGAVLEAAVDFTLTLAQVALAGVAVALLATLFGGRGGWRQGLKLAAYSGTAYWVAGLFALYPSLGLVAGLLAGLYSLYTLQLGLPVLMRVAPERQLSAFAAVLAAVLGLALLKHLLVARVAELGGPLRAAQLASGLA